MYLFITKDFESYINNTDMANDFDKVVKDFKQYGGLYLLMDNPAANFDNDFKTNVRTKDYDYINNSILSKNEDATPFYVIWDITDYMDTQTLLHPNEKKSVLYRFAAMNGIVRYHGYDSFDKWELMKKLRDIKQNRNKHK